VSRNFEATPFNCCAAGCHEHYLPRWWKIDFEDAGMTGDFFGFNIVHKVPFLEGPAPTWPHACHWKEFVGAFQSIDVYKQYDDVGQIWSYYYLLMHNGGSELWYRSRLEHPSTCWPRELEFWKTNPPDTNWGQPASVWLRPWEYADDSP